MVNPKSLVYQLYQHWDFVEAMMRYSRDYPELNTEQAIALVGKVDPSCQDPHSVLRTLTNAEVLHIVHRSGEINLNPVVLDFVRSLTHEHELGLSSVLAARVSAIRTATEYMNQALKNGDNDQIRQGARQLGELFRQISLQLHQDRDAILAIAEQARSAETAIPLSKRYRNVLEAYDKYIEPMNQMMDSGPDGTFYQYLESADEGLEIVYEQLRIQGELYSHQKQIRNVSYQAKELRRIGRTIAQQCADTLLPLREELRAHSNLAASISKILGQVRKRSLRRALPLSIDSHTLPACRQERTTRISVGDEVRTIIAEAKNYQPVVEPFPETNSSIELVRHAWVDQSAVIKHLKKSLPVKQLMAWLVENYGYLPDAMILQLYHELVRVSDWKSALLPDAVATELKNLRVFYYPHQLEEL
ncbi:hypothetical protein [Alteromonas australica]|uniref:hypothetical protein n=1 Tax=Alteromonas australica TaxID=589873 RepID=UPI000C542D4E|nr:hypothetical protein [Alteromonas sp.]